MQTVRVGDEQAQGKPGRSFCGLGLLACMVWGIEKEQEII